MKASVKKKKEEFHDLLVPILILLCVLPLLVYLTVYDCGYSEYLWYNGDGIRTDVYSYCKSRLFMVVAVFCVGILAFRMALYRDKIKSWKICFPLFGYAGLVLLSAVLSENLTAAFAGNLDSFENALVLAGYAVVCIYTYQVMDTEKDYRVIWGGVLVILGIMLVQGILQIFKIDLLDMEWMQHLIMSAEEFESYGGRAEHTFVDGTVYLTLYNPDYAGVYMSMLLAITGVMALTETERKKKTIYVLAAVSAAVVMWFTDSRSAVVAAVVGCAVLAICLRKKFPAGLLRRSAAGIAILLMILGIADAVLGFPHLAEMTDYAGKAPLESLLTTEKGVELIYEGQTWIFTIEEDGVCILDGEGNLKETVAELEEFTLPFEEEAYIYPVQGEYGLEFWMYLEKMSLEFVKTEEGYYYRTLGGKLDSMTEIDRVDFHGMESMGAGRVYIWSRTLPLLKKYMLLGSGPDTFPEAFPQNDYVGKVVYAHNPGRIIEKGHNDFLTKWVQTGFLSVLCCVLFYILLIKKSFQAYSGRLEYCFSRRLGLGCFIACICYMTASFFNDSTIQTAPLFWICAGLALSVGEQRA